jgi:hypothetical protein
MAGDLAPFESPKELIQGAKEQLAQLGADVTAFGGNCPYEIITRTDNKTGEKVVALRLQRRFPPRIRRIASSILKEARLALDQAMCEAAVSLGRKDAKGVYFPFGKSAADLRHSRRTKCDKVDRRIVAYAMRFKPSYRGNPMLWTLARLATYSHESIIAARPQDTGAYMQQAFVSATGPLQLTINKWNDFHNEMEIARLPANGSLTLNPNAPLPLQVIFGESGEAVKGRQVTTALHDLISIAESVVLGMEAETARLKAGIP